MPFLPPNQQRQSTEGISILQQYYKISELFTVFFLQTIRQQAYSGTKQLLFLHANKLSEQDMNSKYGKKVVLAIQWQATENTYSK